MDKHAASGFNTPEAAASYAANPPRLVPGFADMQRMALLLLSEAAPEDARILVLGAGGGLELKVFAEARPGWRFAGVDPAGHMLALARETLGPLSSRVDLIEGYVEAAPQGPFDGAACLLTLHFIERGARLETLRQIRRRLRPGALLVTAHHSIPDGPGEREKWLDRFAAFAVSSGVDPASLRNAAKAIQERLPLLSPDEDAALLSEAGFSNVSLFYAAFTFRGWVATA